MRAEQREIKSLPAIQFPEIRLPYNWKELLEMTDRLSQRSPEQRQVFYELVRSATMHSLNRRQYELDDFLCTRCEP
jgi:hypothetical protein